jgi:hypothetical protein
MRLVLERRLPQAWLKQRLSNFDVTYSACFSGCAYVFFTLNHQGVTKKLLPSSNCHPGLRAGVHLSFKFKMDPASSAG